MVPDSAEPSITSTRLYRSLGWVLRVYVLSLAIVGVYSLLWLAELAGFLDERTLGIIWLAVAGMGAAFLLLLVPLYLTSRRR